MAKTKMPFPHAQSEHGGPLRKEFDRFVLKASRGPRQSVQQRIIVDHLVRAAASTDHLLKTFLLSETAILAKDWIAFSMDDVECAFVVSNSLARVKCRPEQTTVAVPWGFARTEKNWRRYIFPWNTIGLTFEPFQTRYAQKLRKQLVDICGRYEPECMNQDERSAYYEDVKENIVRNIAGLPEWQRFFEMTASLSMESYQDLRTEFQTWSLGRLLPIGAKTAEQLDCAGIF